jgi:hypothetical protein
MAEGLLDCFAGSDFPQLINETGLLLGSRHPQPPPCNYLWQLGEYLRTVYVAGQARQRSRIGPNGL